MDFGEGFGTERSQHGFLLRYGRQYMVRHGMVAERSSVAVRDSVKGSVRNI